MIRKQKQLFKTRIVPGKKGSGKLFEEEFVVDDGPVECLGMTFENDEKRREYFLEKLREKLKDPEFRKIEGFPIGEDEDIAHSYHTKVPHKAIMRYIIHYTEPGDIVFDRFCGTGMTGVAAQMCGDKSVVKSLGVTKDSPEQKYKVEGDGTILEKQVNEDGKNKWVPFSKLGLRRTILNDLSPSATFITYNYNTPVDAYTFEREAKRILKEIEDECGWMYETLHTDGKTKGRIEYTVWSEIFICPNCTGEVVFLDEALDDETKRTCLPTSSATAFLRRI